MQFFNKYKKVSYIITGIVILGVGVVIVLNNKRTDEKEYILNKWNLKNITTKKISDKEQQIDKKEDIVVDLTQKEKELQNRFQVERTLLKRGALIK